MAAEESDQNKPDNFSQSMTLPQDENGMKEEEEEEDNSAAGISQVEVTIEMES